MHTKLYALDTKRDSELAGRFQSKGGYSLRTFHRKILGVFVPRTLLGLEAFGTLHVMQIFRIIRVIA